MRCVGVCAFLHPYPVAVLRRFLLPSARNDLSNITQKLFRAFCAADRFRLSNRSLLLVRTQGLRQPTLAAANSCALTQMQMTAS